MLNSIATLITDIQSTVRPYLEMQMAAKKELITGYKEASKKVNAMDFSEEIEKLKEVYSEHPHINERTIKATLIDSALSDIGYTQTLISRYTNITAAALDKKLSKDLEHSLGKIKEAVTKRIKDAGTVETIKNKYIDRKTQFVEGAWILTHTDGTTKTLTVESIVAGGHNIQCLHFRTLYKYK